MRSLLTSPLFLTRFVAGVLAVAFVSAIAAAQQATEGELPRERTVPAEEKLRLDLENSRLRLGPLRLIPRFAVSGGYESNVFGTTSNETDDWTLATTVGTRFVLPLGSKVYLHGTALPRYIWYAELEERRRWTGAGDAALIGFFNRVSLEVGARGSRTYGLLSAENPIQTLDDLRQAFVRAEVEISNRILLFGRGELLERRHSLEEEVPDVDLENARVLDRDIEFAQAGIRFLVWRSLELSVIGEQTRTEFLASPERDNETEAVNVGLRFNRPRLFINLIGGYRNVRPTGEPPLFSDLSTATGSYFVSFFLLRPVELQAYGHRRLGYGLTRINPYYLETLNGGAVQLRIRNRFILRGFGEYTDVDYPVNLQLPEGGTPGRRDSVTTFGGGISMRVFRDISLTAQISESEYRSRAPVETTTIQRITTGLSFGGEFSR
ncbi:MAG: hypothetical protein ABR576_09085 [Thermoanaerobaculia bacterium]